MKIKEIMSNMLDAIIGINIANTHTDGSYETKNLDVETFENDLRIQWFHLVAEIGEILVGNADMKRILREGLHCTLFSMCDGSGSKLEKENKQLKEFIEETDNLEAYKQWCVCNEGE